MSDSDPFSTTATDREYTGSFFVCVCLLAVVVASGAFATVTASPGADTASTVGPLSVPLPSETGPSPGAAAGGDQNGTGGLLFGLPGSLGGGFVPPNVPGGGGGFDLAGTSPVDAGALSGATGDTGVSGSDSGSASGTGSGSPSNSEGGSITGAGIDINFGDSGGGTSSADGGYTVVSNRSLTPGARVALTVTDDDGPVSGIPVSFNGERIGVTDSQGTVVGTVPYSATLTVSVASDTAPSVAPPARPASRTRSFSVGPVGPQQVANESFDVDTNVTLSLSGPPRRGANLTLTATIRDVPMRQAVVTMDGQRVGTTDDQGQVALRLPEASGPVTLTVRRDAINGSRTVEVGDFVIETEPSLPLALPGTPTTILVRVGGEPVSNATVARSGGQQRSTDANGTATVSLPLADSTTVTVTKNGYREQQVVGGLFLNLGAVVTGALTVLGGAGYGLRRRGITRHTVATWFRRVRQVVLGTLFDAADAFDTALSAFLGRCRETVTALRGLLTGRTTPGALWTAFRQWVRDTLASLGTAVDTATTAARSADPRTDPTAAEDPQTTIQEAWGRFLDCVSARGLATSTPGEIATHAVEEDGLPPDAVATLREAFRAVEYGQRDPSDRAGAVETAIRHIERASGRTSGDGTEGHPP